MLKKLKSNKDLPTKFFLSLLVLIAGILRFYNLNWDLGNYFHPDERNIAIAVIGIRFFSQLDPKFFAYGGFSIYLYRFAAEVLTFLTKDIAWTTQWMNIDLIGRFFSAVFSTATIVPLYLLVKKIADKKTGILAVVFYTFTVTSIQTAHFGVTESLITFVGISICLLSVIVSKKINPLTTLALGMITGIGIAAKTSAIAFVIMPLFAYFLAEKISKKNIVKKIIHLAFFLAISFVVFLIFSPYTFINWNKFIESMRYESGVATGALPVVYTFQFNHTIPYLFQIMNFFWQIGINAIFCVIGFLFVLVEMVRRKNKALLIFTVFPLLYFLYVGSWHTKFIRYMVPIIPFLLIASSLFLMKIRSRFKRLGNTLIIIAVFGTIIWALAFFSIYIKPQTRIAASQWIYTNVPYESILLNEQWDDGLPIPLGQFNPSQYLITPLDMYSQDNQLKINYLSANLSNADYIIFNSRRLYGTLINLTDKYPVTSKYYKLLFAGKLGYKQVAQFSSYPSIFGLTINDNGSEETFQVYDHPKVIIFKNVKHYSVKEYRKLL